MPLKLENAWSVRYKLESLSEWEKRREGNPQFLIGGTYYTDALPEVSIGLLETIKENLCRTKMAEIAVELRQIGVIVELDFDFDAHLSAMEMARLAEEQRRESIAVAAEESREGGFDDRHLPDPDSD